MNQIVSMICPMTRSYCTTSCIAMLMDDKSATCLQYGVTVDHEGNKTEYLTKSQRGSRVEPKGSGSQGVFQEHNLISQAMDVRYTCKACNSVNVTRTDNGYHCNECHSESTFKIREVKP